MHATSRTGNRTKDSLRGFTLLEVLVVIAILALIAGALPLALNRTLPSRRVAVTSDAVIDAIRHAYATSAVSGGPVGLELSAEGDLMLVRPGNVGGSARVRALDVPEAAQVRIADQDGRERDRVTVYPDGSTSGARIEISSGSRRAIVTVSALTGRVVAERS